MMFIFEVDKEIPREDQDASWESDRGLIMVRTLASNTARSDLRRQLRAEASSMAIAIVEFAEPYFVQELIKSLEEKREAVVAGRGRGSHRD